MKTLLMLALMASPALAQQDDSRVRRLKERLNLNEEQAAKVREIYRTDTDERNKLDESRQAKIAELLNADQKKLYEDMNRGRGGAGGGGNQFQFGGGQGFGGGNRGMGMLNLDDLKRELTLTDEQSEKIKPIVEEFNAAITKRMEDMRAQGLQGLQGLNFGEMFQKYQDDFKQVTEKIKAHLNEEQKTKMDALVERTTGWMRLLPGMIQQRLGGGGATTPSRLSVEERVRRAMDALKVEKDDERSAIADLVTKIVRAQHDLEDYMKSSKDRLSEAAKDRELSDTAIEDRIKEVSEERRKRERELAALQKQLVEVVSNRQELELIVHGILR